MHTAMTMQGVDSRGRRTARWLLLGAMMAAMPMQAQAQSESAPPLRHEINKGLVGIMGPALHTTASEMSADIARTISDGNELRVVPNIGRGSFQTIQDLLYMRGIDVGLVNSAVLQYFAERDIIPGIDITRHIRFIAPLYDAEYHLFARADITSIEQLDGQKVSYGSPTSASNMTSSLIFSSLGITPEVVHLNHSDSIQALLSGEIAAFTISDGKPWNRIVDIDRQSGIHLLAIPPGREYRGSFKPTQFTSDDYPNLIAPGETIPTLANQLIMAVYNWPEDHPRRRNVARFVDAFFSNLEKLKSDPSTHQKWRVIDAYQEVPGWERFESGSPAS